MIIHSCMICSTVMPSTMSMSIRTVGGHNRLLLLSAAFGASHGWFRIIALHLRLGLFAHHALVMATGGCSAHLHRIVLLIWILRGLIRLKYVRCSRPLQFSIAHILWLPLTTRCLCIACRDKRWILPEYLLEVEPSSCCPLFFLDLCVVQFDQGL